MTYAQTTTRPQIAHYVSTVVGVMSLAILYVIVLSLCGTLIVQFYSHLFSSETIDSLCKQTCFASIENHIDFSQQQSCEGFLSLQELIGAIRFLNLCKSPGSDGFSVDFYLHFWEILGPLLLHVANQCFRDGNLYDSMKGSITRLIYKKRGDIKNLENC